MKQLYLKYHEDIKPITDYEEQISLSTALPTLQTIKKLKELQEAEIKNIAVKHKLMDRLEEKEPWEDIVKKKFWLNQIKNFDIHEQYAKTIFPEIKRFVFYETAYMVLCEGDIISLKSGPNNSGKTSSSLVELRWANYFLRNYWKVSKFSDKYEPLDKFSMRKNVFYYPDASQIADKIAEATQYNCIDINEGMKAAVNLKSWDPETIDMINDIFTERSKHNFLMWEYQAAKRPPKMLLTRFNVWEHKMGQKWLVVSMPSSLYRTEDPMYMGEVEKLKGDRAISAWFTHRWGNANFIDKFKSPKLKDKYKNLFDKIKRQEKEKYERGKKVRKTINNIWYTFVEDMWNKVDQGSLAYVDLKTILEEKGFKDPQIKQFLRDYDKYDRNYHIIHPKNKEKEED